MSERGSFVTEYIYCSYCFQAAKSILLDNRKYLCSRVTPSWEEGGKFPLLPIIAGKVGGAYSGQELVDFETDYIPKLERLICHPLRVAVLAENGEQIFTAHPARYAPGL